MSLPNHNADGASLGVYQMVLNRLWFVVDNPGNTDLVNAFVLELFSELEVCFQVSIDPAGVNPPDLTKIGDENNYTVNQRSIVADLVCVYLIMVRAYGANFLAGKGNTLAALGSGTFLKEAKADTVEAQYEQFDERKIQGSQSLSADAMITMFKKSAIRKARTQGCMIDIAEDSTLAVDLMMKAPIIMPFIHIKGGGDCGCR